MHIGLGEGFEVTVSGCQAAAAESPFWDELFTEHGVMVELLSHESHASFGAPLILWTVLLKQAKALVHTMLQPFSVCLVLLAVIESCHVLSCIQGIESGTLSRGFTFRTISIGRLSLVT